jgi:hypothetical protein
MAITGASAGALRSGAAGSAPVLLDDAVVICAANVPQDFLFLALASFHLAAAPNRLLATTLPSDNSMTGLTRE